MTDIELVIKIPEEIYHNIKIGNSRSYSIRNIAIYAIENGKPLPKGHGRLGDLDELAKSTLCKTFGLRSVDIENAPTIIPAEESD